VTAFLDEMEKSVPALRRYARALTRNADRADDLVQDCLERAIRKRALWAPKGTVEAWLFKLLVNIWRNDLRSTRRRGEHVPIDGMLVEPAVAAAQPGRIALAEMSRALDTLPAEQREALLLVVLEDKPYAEAAEILSIPIGTLMSRISRARAALKQMTGQGDEPRLRSVK
jgi:RNA polymerase sigma-70 factor (ECF subfamily)